MSGILRKAFRGCFPSAADGILLIGPLWMKLLEALSSRPILSSRICPLGMIQDRQQFVIWRSPFFFVNLKHKRAMRDWLWHGHP